MRTSEKKLKAAFLYVYVCVCQQLAAFPISEGLREGNCKGWDEMHCGSSDFYGRREIGNLEIQF